MIGASAAMLSSCGGGSAGGPQTTAAVDVVSVATAAAPTPNPSPTPTPTAGPVVTVTQAAAAVAGRYTPAAAAIPTTGIALPIGKCVNIAGLEGPSKTDLGNMTQADFDIIRAGGFATVRIVVRWDVHAPTTAPYTIDPVWMNRVHQYAAMAGKAGLHAIIDMHAFDDMNTDPVGSGDRFVSFWQQIGEGLRDIPDTVYFELLNEPSGIFKTAVSLPLYTRAIQAIRKSSPTRPVIIGGWYLSSIDGLAWLQLPDDPYVVPTFHLYDPMPFTHQGATWTTIAYPVGQTYGSDQDYATLDAELQAVKDYMKRTGRVPFLGEYGAYTAAADADRARYYATVSAAFASIGVQSCAWSYNNTGFRLHDAGGWLQPLTGGIATTTN